MFTRACWSILFLCAVVPLDAAEPIAEEVLAPPATRSVAAVENEVVAPAADVALSQYLYIEFPRRVQALEHARQLAEAELALIERRVDSFRPFRSFHEYGATYFVDQSWQIALLAAERRLDCIAIEQADLWRQRQAVVAMFMAATGRN